MSEEPIIAIVPAAGVGERARIAEDGDRPKQYRLLLGEPMLRHAVRALLADPRVTQVRVVVSGADTWVEDALEGLPRTVIRRCGGATRADTVANALRDAALDPRAWVMVHDAARPGLPAAQLADLIEACTAHDQAGLLAMPVADTVKRAGVNGEAVPVTGVVERAAVSGATVPLVRVAEPMQVAQTIERNGLWLAQTPQMARSGQLIDALARAQAGQWVVTDESQALELAGHPALLVRGSVRNSKVTWPEDFDLMEKWL